MAIGSKSYCYGSNKEGIKSGHSQFPITLLVLLDINHPDFPTEPEPVSDKKTNGETKGKKKQGKRK